MSAVQLTRKVDCQLGTRYDLSAIVPSATSDQLANQSIRLTDSQASIPLTELFEISEFESATECGPHMVIEGDLTDCDRISGRQTEGCLEIRGNAGDWLADGMRGGELLVTGSAGHFAGSGLINGKVVVQGDSGDYTAGADISRRRGMRGGVLCIEGNSGNWLASRMRGGQLIVNGSLGIGAATDMIAGTILFFEAPPLPLAVGAKRGTLLLANQGHFETSGFTPPEMSELSFLPMLLRSLANHSMRGLENPQMVKRSIGDRTSGGQAEIIFLKP